jgi:hypothetical protein
VWPVAVNPGLQDIPRQRPSTSPGLGRTHADEIVGELDGIAEITFGADVFPQLFVVRQEMSLIDPPSAFIMSTAFNHRLPAAVVVRSTSCVKWHTPLVRRSLRRGRYQDDSFGSMPAGSDRPHSAEVRPSSTSTTQPVAAPGARPLLRF